jgi:hypothetical protein
MIKKSYLIPLTVAFCLATALFIAVSAQPPGEPEPINPVPNPSPFSVETDMLILRGTKATSGDDKIHHLLIDEDTPYPNQNVYSRSNLGLFDSMSRVDQEWVGMKLTGIKKIYENDFIYERNPPKGYIISGMPSVSLTFNVTKISSNDPSFTLVFYTSLYKHLVMDPEASWTEIVDFGDYAKTYHSGPPYYQTEWQHNLWFGKSMHEPVYVSPYERLALRVTVWGSCADPSGTTISLKFLHQMNSDEFLVNIPIQYE